MGDSHCDRTAQTAKQRQILLQRLTPIPLIIIVRIAFATRRRYEPGACSIDRSGICETGGALDWLDDRVFLISFLDLGFVDQRGRANDGAIGP